MLDDLDLGERKNHPDAGVEHPGFALEELVREMPREHEVVIRLHLARLVFTDDRYVRSDGARAELVGIPLRGALDDAMVDAAPLQDRVALRGRAVDVNLLAFALQ